MYASDVYQGRQQARVPPPPSRVERRLGYPRANFFIFPSIFFYFFLPYPIKAPIYPFSFPLRGFLFLCVYFPIRVSFRVSEGKKRGKYGLFVPPILCLCGYYVLYSHFLLCFSAVFFSCISLLFLSLCYVLALSFVVDAVFFVDLPILLPSVGLSSLLCVIIRLGVFRGSEAEKSVLCCACVVYIRKKGGRDICVSHPPLCLWLVISCAGMMSCCCVG